MSRLSEETLDELESEVEEGAGIFGDESVELIAGYRRANAYELLLREWVEELDAETCEDGKCPICGVSPAETHEDACPVERTRALLADVGDAE